MIISLSVLATLFLMPPWILLAFLLHTAGSWLNLEEKDLCNLVVLHPKPLTAVISHLFLWSPSPHLCCLHILWNNWWSEKTASFFNTKFRTLLKTTHTQQCWLRTGLCPAATEVCVLLCQLHSGWNYFKLEGNQWGPWSLKQLQLFAEEMQAKPQMIFQTISILVN